MNSSQGLPRIGIVGVGRMGANMALRLHDEQYPVACVYDTRIEATSEISEATGAQIASVSRASPSSATSSSRS